MHAVSMMMSAAAVAANQWSFRGEEHSGELINTVNPTICDPNVKQYAGTYSIDSGKKDYFYWAFNARNSTAETKTILWMTGGPGCSSEVALFYENGPCHVNKDGTGTVNNPYSWNNNANLIYIDQPAGVGFSTGTMDDKDEKGVAEDMYQFLQALFKDHPEWNTEFYIFGESYGGHYAPATAHRVWEGMQSGEGIRINLAGLGVGNGLTDPEIQYNYYGQLAYNFSISYQNHPIVTLSTYESMQSAIPNCIKEITKCNNGGSALTCEYAQQVCNAAEISPYSQTGMNPYDIRVKCAVPPLCYDMSNIDTYLNTKSTQEALGVNAKWESCNFNVNRQFAADWMKNYQDQIPDLLANGIRVLIYAGEVDFICNWLGNKAWTLALPWPGKAAFNAAQDHPWNVQGTQAGIARTAQNFTFLQVHNAGHMVPADQPLNAVTMVEQFLAHKPF
eukprot:TRINITY_DN4798_c0_g1_i1.p1 TRINITY_DN4798_c0_g1~~TRINITY_DN4798_c0_g1_i1.p1  ORF type:complete len:447 (+),score=117.97 TRINITY_DN4798_c0_g1_i1:48-1388(+)